MFEDRGDKTEPATAHRREEARREGNVARSADLTAAFMLLGGVAALSFFAPVLLTGMRRIVEASLAGGDPGEPVRRLVLWTLLPFALVLVVIGWSAGLIQTGFLFKPALLTPKLSRLSPAQWLGQLFSGRGVTRMLMSLIKLFVVAGAAGLCVWLELPRIAGLVGLETEALAGGISKVVWGLAWRVAGVLLLLGLSDYGLQRWHRERGLRMTRRESKEDLRHTEGDPVLRRHRAKVARQATTRHGVEEVAGADLVVVHPSRFAVAVRHREGGEAPQVVAKGTGRIADRIRREAEKHGVTVVERPGLARALHRDVETGCGVTQRHYAEVAELLAGIFLASGRKGI